MRLLILVTLVFQGCSTALDKQIIDANRSLMLKDTIVISCGHCHGLSVKYSDPNKQGLKAPKNAFDVASDLVGAIDRNIGYGAGAYVASKLFKTIKSEVNTNTTSYNKNVGNSTDSSVSDNVSNEQGGSDVRL